MRPAIQELSHVKEEQERSVGESFAERLTALGRKTEFVEQLPENDHDFVLNVEDRITVVQAAEVNDYGFLVPLTLDEYLGGETRFNSFQFHGDDQYFGIDVERRNDAVANVVSRKLEKSYQPLESQPLWLLIWSSGSLVGPTHFAGGVEVTTLPFVQAAQLIQDVGSQPFVEIWYFHLLLAPRRIDVGILDLPLESQSSKFQISLSATEATVGKVNRGS